MTHSDPFSYLVSVEFSLDGQKFTGLNGGPIFKFTPALSLQVDCKDQDETDHFYNKLGEGGDTSLPCGWLTVSYILLDGSVIEVASSAHRQFSGRSSRVTANDQFLKEDQQRPVCTYNPK